MPKNRNRKAPPAHTDSPEHSVRIPPYSEQAEKAVLGSILYDPKMFRLCTREGLPAEAFYVPAHKIVYEAICEVANAGQSPDTLLVTERLRNTDKLDFIGGPMFITKLVDDTPTSTHMPHYLEIVHGKYKRRQVIELCRNAEHEAYTSDEPEVALLSRLKFGFHKLSFIKEVAESILDITYRLEQTYRKAKDTGTVGLRSRWLSFNKRVLGYPKGKITVVAARPTMGKTAMALNEALYMALAGNPALIISLEMDREEIVERLISDLMGLNLEIFKNGSATYQGRQAFLRGGEIIASLPIYIEDQVCTVEQISALIRDYKEEKGIVFCVVDYIQIIASTPGMKFQNRNMELTHMSQIMMHTAKETGVHVMVLSQLSRPINRDTWFSWEPELHHLRDCGAIEQDAHMVVFIYQDPDEGNELYDDNAPTIFKIAKIRGAKVSKTSMFFEKSLVRFTGMDNFSLRQILKDKFPTRPVRAVNLSEEDPACGF